MLDDFEKWLSSFNIDPSNRKVPLVLYRKGGDPLDWGSPGGNVYAPVSTILQIGCFDWTGAAATSGAVSQALQGKYSAEPLVWVQVKATSPAAHVTTRVTSAGDSIDITWKSDVNITLARFVYLVIGGPLHPGHPA
jgi:hypothetical protein